ncbi:hypothetical protein KCV07_g6739, partial [Aureobasidium melanogenum]
MASSSKRITRGDDLIPRSSFAMASAPPPARHPAEVAYLRNPLLYNIDRHSLLKPEIIAIVFSYLANDDDDDGDDGDDDYDALWTMAQCTGVCRKWYLEGHHLVWRRVQLRDLFHVQDPIRRRHHAALVEELDFQLDDTILSTTRMVDAALSFPRLHCVTMEGSNLVNVRPENLAALMTPTLRSWDIERDVRGSWPNRDRDVDVLLDALLAGCGSLTVLHFDLWCDDTPKFLLILERIHSIEYLDLGDVGEDLAHDFPQEFLIQLFNKPRLGYLSFPHAVELSQSTVDTFLAAMGRHWTFPTIHSLGKPQFDSGTTAARLISRMPNLERLWLSIDPWQFDLEHVFTATAILEKLEFLELEFKMRACNIEGSWLLKLTSLTCLQTFKLEIHDAGTISLTGTQLANFLVGLPQLEHLSLDLGALEVSCVPEEKAAIDSALANIETT